MQSVQFGQVCTDVNSAHEKQCREGSPWCPPSAPVAGVALMIFESGMHFDFEKAKARVQLFFFPKWGSYSSSLES